MYGGNFMFGGIFLGNENDGWWWSCVWLFWCKFLVSWGLGFMNCWFFLFGDESDGEW